jgi:phospholipid/cholesterol/gamma-HCH transport system substrate-binding protein
MAKEASKNIRLGVFVLMGTIFLIAALYMVGNNNNLFGNTFRVSAEFYDVNGLMPGNNVRFSGINVGTVESVEIVSDSTVKVTMVIEQDVRQYIRKNAIASIGTDGLMGNKIVNINAGGVNAEMLEEGDVLQTTRPIDQDEMIRTLSATNNNMQIITSNLRTITDRINSKNSLWSLLMDTVVAENVKASIVNIRVASNQSAILTGDLAAITAGVRNGKGTIGALITDTSIASGLKQAIVKFENINDSVAIVTGDISAIIKGIRNGEGTIGVLLNDTSFVHNLNAGMENVKDGSVLLNEDLEALRHSWPFRKYFRKQARLKSKQK